MSLETQTPDQTRSIVTAQVVTVTTTFTSLTRGIYVGTAGDLSVTFDDDTVITFGSVANGYHPLQVKAIQGTLTTATGVIACF